MDIHGTVVLDIHAERVYDMIGKGESVSFEATKWVLESAPNLPSHLAMTLVALAWHADKEGNAAYPSQPTLARYARKSERAVRKDLRELLELGLIRRGDARRVEHLPADKRPTVYDVVIGPDGSGWNHSSARNSSTARKRGTGRKPSSRAGGTTDPLAGGTTVPPKVVPTELQVEPPVELPLSSPPAPEAIDAEIVETTNLPAVVSIPNAGQLTRAWIDHCASHDVKLPTSTIKRYGKHISEAMKQGFDPNLIKRALAQMLADGEAARPSLFDNYLVRAQSGPARGPRKLTPGETTAAKFTTGANGAEVRALLADILKPAENAS